jgi:hypothetical protein
MMTLDEVRKLALSFPEAEEHAHFEKPSFRVKKKIFATLWVPENCACVKLTPIDQSVFVDFNNEIFTPVTGAWGKKGWTLINLKKVRKDMFKDALTLAYNSVVPKKILRRFSKTNNPKS